MQGLIHSFQVKAARVQIFSSKAALGLAAADQSAQIIRKAIESQGYSRVIFATGPSQDEVVKSLIKTVGVKWQSVEVFHMDEYVGISKNHPASFRNWLKTRIADVVHPGKVNYLEGDAEDLASECRRFSDLLSAAPIDLCFPGFGENGHIAFNDPHVADFADPLLIKRVTMDIRCRQQQVNEGNFPNLQAVPNEAVTMTCPALKRARYLVCCVPDRRKAKAVRDAIEGSLSTACPASLVFTHPRAFVYLDEDSASLLDGALRGQ